MIPLHLFDSLSSKTANTEIFFQIQELKHIEAPFYACKRQRMEQQNSKFYLFFQLLYDKICRIKIVK